MNIKDIKTEIEISKKVLQTVQEYHSCAKDYIKLKEHNRQLILYILGGRSITLCHTALFLLNSSKLSGYGSIIRLIYETNESIWYFCKIEENDEAISKWFKNKIIPPKKLRRSIIQTAEAALENTAEGLIGNSNQLKELLLEVYSRGSEYIHPTFGISSMNLNKHTKIFDYEWLDYIGNDITIFISISEAIINMIQTFFLPDNIYKIDKQKGMVLSDQIKTLKTLEI